MKGLCSVERVIDAAQKVVDNITEERKKRLDAYLVKFIGPKKTWFLGLIETRPLIQTIEEAEKWIRSDVVGDFKYYELRNAGRDQQAHAQRLLDAGLWFRENGVSEVWVTDKDADVLDLESGVKFP